MRTADCCIANVYAGFLWMLLEAPDGAGACRQVSRRGRAYGRRTRRAREQLNVAVLRAWIADDVPRALCALRQLTDEFPRDLVMVKMQQYFEFNRGNSPAMLRAVAQGARATTPTSPTCTAWRRSPTSNVTCSSEAERAARRALELKRKEPWAQHALAHVMLTRGPDGRGGALPRGRRRTWTGLNSFMITHLWWHLALFDLSQGRFARRARDLRPALLGRRQGIFAGSDRRGVAARAHGDRGHRRRARAGRSLRDHLAARAQDTVLPFLTLQYLYGLARARRAEARHPARCGADARADARRRTCARSGGKSRCPRAKGFMRMRAAITRALGGI